MAEWKKELKDQAEFGDAMEKSVNRCYKKGDRCWGLIGDYEQGDGKPGLGRSPTHAPCLTRFAVAAVEELNKSAPGLWTVIVPPERDEGDPEPVQHLHSVRVEDIGRRVWPWTYLK